MRWLPDVGPKTIEGLNSWLEKQGLTLGMEPELKEEKPIAAQASKQPTLANATIETHDEYTTIGDQLLPAGAVSHLRDAKKADAIVRAAKEVFAATDGEHRDGDDVSSAYSFAIKRLPPQATEKGKTYPVYLSDAALKVLSQPEVLAEFHQKAGEFTAQARQMQV